MQTDALFYHLFKTIPGLFFEIAKLDYPPKAYQFSSIEVKQIAFRLDGVFKPPETELNLPIIFVEVQFQPDKQFYARFFSEIFSLSETISATTGLESSGYFSKA
jgi:predicted transposase/invertase (TIGR01784 family)